MQRGIAVLTNGKEWRLWDVQAGKRFSRKPDCTVIIYTSKNDREDGQKAGSLQSAAEALHRWLAK